MKLNKTLMMVALAAGSLFASSTLQAQDTPKDKPADNKPATPAPGARRPGFSFDNIAKQLDLTEDQKVKAKPIFEDMQKQIAELRKDASLAPEDRPAKVKAIRDGAAIKLKEILTAEQFAKWEKMGAGMRRPGGAGGPPPGAPGEGAKDKAPKN